MNLNLQLVPWFSYRQIECIFMGLSGDHIRTASHFMWFIFVKECKKDLSDTEKCRSSSVLGNFSEFAWLTLRPVFPLFPSERVNYVQWLCAMQRLIRSRGPWGLLWITGAGCIDVTEEPADFGVKEDDNLSPIEYELVSVVEGWLGTVPILDLLHESKKLTKIKG